MKSDTPYDQIEQAQAWWRSVDLEPQAKDLVGRTNAIKLFKLPLTIWRKQKSSDYGFGYWQNRDEDDDMDTIVNPDAKEPGEGVPLLSCKEMTHIWLKSI